MRNNGRAFLSTKMQKQTQDRVETRDAVVFDIDITARKCRVKIQGSSEYIVAFFPQNWQMNPAWLKTGNAVRITHRGGIRGRIEVVSDGQVVPTGVGVTPTPATPTDAILTGCGVVQIPTGPQAFVMALTGTLRVNGLTVVVPSISMASAPLYNMTMGGLMGNIAGVFAMPTPPSAGLQRLDMIVASSAGIVSYIQGTASSAPVLPSLPSGSFMLNYILMYNGMTQITQHDIGRQWTTASLTNVSNAFTVNPSSGVNFGTWTLADGSVKTGYETTLSCFDQYGALVNGPGLGWPCKVDIVVGSATVYAYPDGTAPNSTSSLSVTIGSTNTFFVEAATADQYASINATIQTSTAAVITPIILPA